MSNTPKYVPMGKPAWAEDSHPPQPEADGESELRKKIQLRICDSGIDGPIAWLVAGDIMQLIQARDAQKLAAVLEAFPEVKYTLEEVDKANEHLDSRSRQSAHDRSAGWIDARGQCVAVVRSVLGNNSKGDNV